MRSYAQEAVSYLGALTNEAFAQDRLRLLALTRAAEVVGEAASQVPHDIRRDLPHIEFSAAIAMRNRLIHGYGSTSPNILAETIRQDSLA